MKNFKRRKWFIGLTAAFLCLAAISLCMTSCRLSDTQDTVQEQEPTYEQQDEMASKIVYYEAQIQSLTSQLEGVAQQMYIMKEDYQHQLETLEQRLTVKEEETEQPSDEQQEPVEPPKDTPISSTEQEQDIVLCEYTYRLENNFAVLTSYLGDDVDVVVPAAVDGYLVIGLADRTFANCNVRSVTLPDTVEKLGWFTFYECAKLEKVVLPGGLSVIGYASFDGCSPALCLYVKSGSYAEQFANSFGLRCEEST